MNQKQHVFLAEGLTPGPHHRDAEESDLEVHRVTVAEFEAMLLDGRIVDNCSAAAWGMYRLWRERQKRVSPELDRPGLCPALMEHRKNIGASAPGTILQLTNAPSCPASSAGSVRTSARTEPRPKSARPP